MTPLRPVGAAALVFIILGSCCHEATAAAVRANLTAKSALRSHSALGGVKEIYTTNAICAKRNCINPIFPGMEDLHRLSQAPWLASSLTRVSEHLSFCRAAISYDPALPIPTSGGSASVKSLVQRQDNAASTMFYYHLNGLGLEAWDYPEPQFADDCVKSIWRMVCFTYFPRSPLGAPDGAMASYIRPCASSCMNYVRSCQVECCDESVKCVFEHTKAIAPGLTETTQGYVPHDGPSSMCTGGASRSAKPFGAIFWAAVVLVMALSLQGCDLEIHYHQVGNWRGEKDYLLKDSVKGSAGVPILNSCSDPNLGKGQKCSGRGTCELWQPDDLKSELTFCVCANKWAGPECRTKRKSQAVAYWLSVFFGFLGADQFYLGYYHLALFKLCTVGGFGFVWMYDIVQIGSAPVPTAATGYLTDHSLDHYIFVLSSVGFAVCWGFLISYVIVIFYRDDRRKMETLRVMQEEEASWEQIRDLKNRRKNEGVSYGTYGTQIPCHNTASHMAGNMRTMPTMMGPMVPPSSGVINPPVMSGMMGRW